MAKSTYTSKLANMTLDELISLKKSMEADPANRRSKDEQSAYVYTSKAMKKLDSITYAIMHKSGTS